ncbi:MAG TPA: TIGR02677 family protein, partial [Solirubrobacteraceae bacterium]|nr:TIGR02677 family protein [Solirubrobacteraceae bacterium]
MESAPFRPFAHLATPNVALYRLIMGEFVAAKRRFVVHLRSEDLKEALARGAASGHVSEEALAEALGKLVGWGNLRADPDTSRVTTVEDFHRARFLYQLTHAGEAAERALGVYEEQLGKRGALQAVALADIATQLRALRELAGEDDPDPARLGLLLRGLVDRSEDLANNAQAFMGSLRRTIELHDADVDAFRAYKDQLVNYLERFIADLLTVGAEISGLLLGFEDAEVTRLLRIVARRDAEDAAPGATARRDGADGPQGEDGERAHDFAGGGGSREDDFAGESDPRDLAYRAGTAMWRERWQGLRQWFVSEPGHPSQAKLLRSRARQAIPDLLAVVATLNERRSGRSDRTADFRALALWFAEAPDEAALHRLWRGAFGLYGSRHLVLDSDTRTAREEQPVPPSTSWREAPPLHISPRLRRTGSYERRGRANRITDREEGRRLLERLVAKQSEQTAAARARLATGRPTKLGELGELDPDAFGLFLSLLGDALAARRPDRREVATTTVDGTLAVRLVALADAGPVEIQTPAGIFRGPDHVIEITDLSPQASGSRPAVPDAGSTGT